MSRTSREEKCSHFREGFSTLNRAHLLKDREHSESDHVLSEVISQFQDQANRTLPQGTRVDIVHLQPHRPLHGCGCVCES